MQEKQEDLGLWQEKFGSFLDIKAHGKSQSSSENSFTALYILVFIHISVSFLFSCLMYINVSLVPSFNLPSRYQWWVTNLTKVLEILIRFLFRREHIECDPFHQLTAYHFWHSITLSTLADWYITHYFLFIFFFSLLVSAHNIDFICSLFSRHTRNHDI